MTRGEGVGIWKGLKKDDVIINSLTKDRNMRYTQIEVSHDLHLSLRDENMLRCSVCKSTS